ncbi:MAG: hypothetical protein J0L61_01210 [Planctomycetes bacterium]|nr:hypothetical protein [Planctomycetota bacterium]
MRSARRLGSGALALALAAGLAGGGTVVIVEGNDTPNNDFLHSLGGAAEANYTAKGYAINRLSNQPAAKTEQEIKDAINAAGVNAVVFLGHGGVDASGNGKPWLAFGYPTGGDASKALEPSDLTGDYSGIKHVEIQACAQNLQAWKDKFPNASLDAWSKTVTGDQMKNDVANGTPARIPQKAPPGPPLPPPPVKSTDTRFDDRILECPQGAGTPEDADFINDWLQFNFQLRPELIPVFPSLQFNVRVFDPETGMLPLRGMVLQNGGLIFNPLGGLPSAQFTMTIDSDAFDIAMANIDTVPQLHSQGRIRIENNVSGRPEQLCFQAAADAYFGLFSLPPVPPCPGDLNLDGLVNTADLAIFLGSFGLPALPGDRADLNHDGVINTLDLAIFLGAFGQPC